MVFDFFANPHVQFGPGKFVLLPELVRTYGNRALLITGSESFQKSNHWHQLLRKLEKKSISFYQATVDSEPSPSIVDGIVQKFRNKTIDVVAAIGGGSVLDSGKAVSAMITKKTSVIEYLDGVGEKLHDGEKIPFIAVPTTSGTGSEATKNAVISKLGKDGFKKSLRHDNFIPDIAIVDPELTLDCPSEITAACGMDALTQLLESLVSTKASVMTDSLVLGALEIMENSIVTASMTIARDIDIRTKISYASYISGLALANAGLGLVHGFASSIGGLFDIPHGVICGTLLAEVTRQNIESLISVDSNGFYVQKYARAAHLLNPEKTFENPVESCRYLVTILEKWTDRLNMPGLASYGLIPDDIDSIVSVTRQKNNPVKLSKQQLAYILKSRL